MSFDYYVHNNLLYRFEKGKKFHGDTSSLEVFYDGKWSRNSNRIKSFMNHYVTGWIDEQDAIDNYDRAKKELTIAKYNAIRDFAIENHNNQKYGKYPYEIHLTNVISVLFRQGVFISENNYSLLASSWLHDILEDTPITHDEFISQFGKEIFDIVWALTDGEGNNRKERKDKMYKKLIHNQNAIIVKLADRIANVEFSLINQDHEHFNKYVIENEELNNQLKNNIQTDLGNKLLKYLNSVILSV